MNKSKVSNLLIDFDEVKVGKYVEYVTELATEKKDGALKNPWVNTLSDNQISEFFKIVESEGLEFDGKHIFIAKTFGKIGINYDYQAYKNKMYLVYPESIIDVGLVKESDIYNSWKENGKVMYKHVTGNPFGNEEIKGAYCIIKNRRGEFLMELSRDDIKKHRAKSKSESTWKEWEDKMTLKTVIKSSVSMHFIDVFQNMVNIDNEGSDLEKPVEMPLELKKEIEEIATKEELAKFYDKHVGTESKLEYTREQKAAIIKTLTGRKQEITEGF